MAAVPAAATFNFFTHIKLVLVCGYVCVLLFDDDDDDGDLHLIFACLDWRMGHLGQSQEGIKQKMATGAVVSL